MGKGTAIKGNSDIDLVLILNEVESAEDLKTKLPSIQGIIIHLLKENSRSLAILPETIKPTPFHVKFSVKGTYENIDVDLLPSFHFNGTYMTQCWWNINDISKHKYALNISMPSKFVCPVFKLVFIT